MRNVLIVGGGVIGLSLAYDLARHGLRVRVLDRGLPGRETSWAGAGILPPAIDRPNDTPLERLTGLSHALHPVWAEQLKAETGVDNGFLRCGAIYTARSEASQAEMQTLVEAWERRGIEASPLDAAALKRLEPNLAGNDLLAAWHVPDEAQIRNPRHVKALLAACGILGVEIDCGLAVDDFEVRGGRLQAVRAGGESLTADAYCITSGAWTRQLLARLGIQPRIKPIRGQIALVDCQRPLLRRVINDGPRYLVPRPDGRLLVGSTEEDAGFDKRTTAAAISGLLRFAIELCPALGQTPLERCWAGLRPGTADGLPYLGPLPGIENAFVAAGHFRQGLHLSPGTAVVMSQLIRGQTPQIDLTPFRVDRG